MCSKMSKEVIILAAFSFVISAIVFSFMLYTIILEERLHTSKDKILTDGRNASSHHAFGLHLDETSINLIVSFFLLISLLEMILSILLIIGIKKNKPGLVIAYFAFGCLLCLLLVVTAVLELVQCLWYAALVTALVAALLTRQLSGVYSVYENMEKENDCNLLLERDELNVPELVDNITCD